jgi:hypothetical protein
MQKNSLQNRYGVVKTLGEWEQEEQSQSATMEVSEAHAEEAHREPSKVFEDTATTIEEVGFGKPKKGKRK